MLKGVFSQKHYFKFICSKSKKRVIYGRIIISQSPCNIDMIEQDRIKVWSDRQDIICKFRRIDDHEAECGKITFALISCKDVLQCFYWISHRLVIVTLSCLWERCTCMRCGWCGCNFRVGYVWIVVVVGYVGGVCIN